MITRELILPSWMWAKDLGRTLTFWPHGLGQMDSVSLTLCFSSKTKNGNTAYRIILGLNEIMCMEAPGTCRPLWVLL